ncbi:sulfatase [Echinicola vietnamensis]|uniref:Arylsulfatase A family protein n=1 Tax=Echinicola vietnamensis (strain DSM 17526 / LMG 23754 / KMM 6221) TaxID=926556 RepID=L0G5G8_ECHVK|nr:sulfatase [Echinicola vietnamensis]AGA80538.1 arylsulfatase A family protein [Echinicola vietnamensis DSM 17526]
MSKIIASTLIALALSANVFSQSMELAGPSEKPNVILINVDDLGWKDLGFMGAEFYETPNLDRLASSGVVFRQAYAGAANCAPSRANMLTGKYGMSHGIYTVHPPDRGDPKTRILIPSHNEKFIPNGMKTLGHLFKENGYVTGTFGKWHVSVDPLEYGFDYNVAGGPQGHPGRGGYFSPFKVDHIKPQKEGEYLTDRLTSEAIDFVESHRDTPFFLYLPFYTVHSPLMAKEEDLKRFSSKEGKPGRNNSTYAAMIYTMDKNVGRLLEKVNELGISENTIVIFTSDNGGIRATSHQDPLRAGKGSYYEGGIRVPMVISWIGTIQADVNNDPVSQMDLFPTLARIIGDEKEDWDLEGSDITAALKGQKMAERDLFWHFPIYLQAYKPLEDQARDPLFRTRPGSVIRSGDWKLHQYFEDGGLELYHLGEDLGEKHNVASEHPEVVKGLLDKLVRWRKKYDAPVPTEPNPSYDEKFEKEQRLMLLK